MDQSLHIFQKDVRRLRWEIVGVRSRNGLGGSWPDWYRYVGISSGNHTLKRWAFIDTNPTDEPITT